MTLSLRGMFGKTAGGGRVLDIFLVLCSAYFISLFLIDTATTEVFMHPEVVDKYPGYLTHKGPYYELGKPFDVRTGEACPVGALYNPPPPAVGPIGARTRNLNYFFDYLDALFTRHVTMRFGMISQFVFALLTALFFYLGLRNLPGVRLPTALLLSSFVLCLPQILFDNGILYRSGKILTSFFAAFLFWLLARITAGKEMSKGLLAGTAFCACLLTQSDEMAVALLLLFLLLLLFYKRYRLALVYSSALGWYLAFRFVLEPALSLHFHGIRISLFGGYSDPSAFGEASRDVLAKTLAALSYQARSVLGTANYLGDRRFELAAAALLCIFLLSLYLRNRKEPSAAGVKKTLPGAGIFAALLALWTGVVYLMALRHPFIVEAPVYGGGYYFMVTIVFFYALALWALARLKFNEGLLAALLLVAATGNLVNTRAARSRFASECLDDEWMKAQRTMQGFITARNFPPDDPVYLKHKKFLDCYKER